jgi:hypothetical protein
VPDTGRSGREADLAGRAGPAVSGHAVRRGQTVPEAWRAAMCASGKAPQDDRTRRAASRACAVWRASTSPAGTGRAMRFFRWASVRSGLSPIDPYQSTADVPVAIRSRPLRQRVSTSGWRVGVQGGRRRGDDGTVGQPVHQPSAARRAARSCGLTLRQDMTRIVLPVALRVALPSRIGRTPGGDEGFGAGPVAGADRAVAPGADPWHAPAGSDVPACWWWATLFPEEFPDCPPGPADQDKVARE